jgi:UDP-N-acetylglucosamine 2-epimerase (non-hydrolysing)
MDKTFFDELELPEPKYNLDVESGTHATQTAKILVGVENVLLKERPDIVLVQGDTNTVLAGALAAAKLRIKVGHVEAGLRSYDRMMPEELNRIMTDHISDYLFAPTETARSNLLKEGIPEQKILVTGNTVADAVQQNLAISKKSTDILDKLKISPKNYFLVTMHRAENVDVKENFSNVLTALKLLTEKYSMPVIFPMHPRTAKMADTFDLSLEGITVVPPVGYLEFLQLEENAKVILTDSGGLQEEGCILGTPCITMRDNTERPETVNVGANILTGTSQDKILGALERMTEQKKWSNPFGEGHAAENILRVIVEGGT